MIINKTTKAFQSRSDKPNSNWLNDDNYIVVPDNSSLTDKVMQYFPRYDLVLDDKGDLIDVVEIPKTGKEINQEKVAEIDKELESIDNQGLNRFLEDIIEKTGIYLLMPEKTKELITTKKELRAEREQLVATLQSEVI